MVNLNVIIIKLGYEYADADDYHPESNKTLMKQGISLNDTNRLPWLLRCRDVLVNWYGEKKDGVLSCSALKGRYRDLLNSNINYEGSKTKDEVDLNLLFVLLNCDQDSIEKRLISRTDHPILKDSRILKSQFETLEFPEENQVLAEMPFGDLSIVKSNENDSYYHFYNVNLINKIISPEEIVEDLKQVINKFFKN